MQPRPERAWLSECRDCGLVQKAPLADGAGNLTCGRCGGVLNRGQPRTLSVLFYCSCIGLVLGAIAVTSPLASVTMRGGRFATSSITTAPEMLRQTGAWELSVAVVFTLILAPALKLLAVFLMTAAVRLERVPGWVLSCFRLVPALQRWAMVEVFVLGALIALVRLGAWMHVDFGPGLWAVAGIALCSLGIARGFDRNAFWRRLKADTPAEGRAGFGELRSCQVCGLVADRGDRSRCERCRAVVEERKLKSLQRTWALVVAATLLTIPANVLPVMTITKLGQGGPSTIIGGTHELIQRGFLVLAVVVFVASVVVPLFKLVTLSVLAVATTRRTKWHLRRRTRLYRFVAIIGRWSMLDIFATMMLVALARFGLIGSVLPGQGATAFCAVVVLTMLAAEAFDPRLMWDAAGENGIHKAAALNGKGLA